MFPIHIKDLEEIEFTDFDTGIPDDQAYKNLLLKEYEACRNNYDEIKEKGLNIYIKSKTPSHVFARVCCNFNKLELGYKDWIEQEGY